MHRLTPVGIVVLFVIALMLAQAGVQWQAVSADGGFIANASVAPQSITAGSYATITATVTSATAATALVDIEVYSPRGAKTFQQFFDNQPYSAGQTSTYAAIWPVPVTTLPGAYTVKIGIFAPAWASLITWNDSAAQLAILSGPAAAFGTWATVSPPGAVAGNNASIDATVTSAQNISTLVDVEIYSSSNQKSFQQFFDNQTFAAGQTSTFAAVWQVPASTPPGIYTAKIGIFSPGWASLYTWNDNASQFPILAVSSSLSSSPSPTTAIVGLHVQGNHLVSGSGQPIAIHGVNRSGTEYSCVQGQGIFDGPSDNASVQAIATWKVNAVRVPLNEDCWLGINGVPSSVSGSAYQQAITSYVNLLNANGLLAILDLHWSAPGTQLANGQQPMPDQDHSLTFWNQVATTYKNNGSVVFELFNEPYPGGTQDTSAGWQCWRDGGACPGVSFQAAGMQALVNTVRQAGATNVVLLGGLDYSGDLTQWLTYKPVDPLNNLAAAWHVYNYNACDSSACFDSQAGTVVAQVPIVATEIGENDCSAAFITDVMNWLDSRGQSYLAWTWDTWGQACSQYSLITNYSGTPSPGYGQGYHDHVGSTP